MSLLRKGNKALRENKFDIAYQAYKEALIAMPELAWTINFNIELMRKRGYIAKSGVDEKKRKKAHIPLPQIAKKLPITVLIITWDIGHNPLGRSYMLAEVVQRIARHSLLVGFQFSKYGDAVWEPVRNGQLPVIKLPGSNLPEFYESLNNIASRIRPDVVIACKPRLPSVALGMMIKEKWGCPLIIDVDDHELSFFKNQSELSLDELAAMDFGAFANATEPYAEIWTRLTQNLCKNADEIIVSNAALQQEFGGIVVPHVRDENTFDPSKYEKNELRLRYGIPLNTKVVLFFGTPRAHKGVETLARAVSQITDPAFRLLVVGAAPDQRVTAKLDQLAPGRVIYLPNQPFAAIPKIMAMADVVCLPQDEGHAISKYQLPAKAIDAVAMGIPLLVSNTPPLLQLVNDQVAELICDDSMPSAICRWAGNPEQAKRWRNIVRGKFLDRYSYSAAAEQMHKIIQKSLARKSSITNPNTAKLMEVNRHVLGIPHISTREQRQSGIDVVVFWKQNDTALYGRRHDMVIKYLASRPDIRKVVVFDAPISEFDLVQRQQSVDTVNQHRWIYVCTYQKLLGTNDTEKISYNVFIYPPGKYQSKESESHKPHLHDGYFPYVNEVLKRENVNSRESIFWIYPKNFSAPALIQHFQPAKVVVDVVDDHRSWPGISNAERVHLTQNYRETLALADMVFANCQPVIESMKEFFPAIRLVPNGCENRSRDGEAISSVKAEEKMGESRKKIVFVGNLEKKIDIPLLDKLARRFNDCDILLIGSTHANPEVRELACHKNVHFLGVVPYAEIGKWLTRADVGIIPHINSDLTQSMNPLKLYVYLSWFVPVVSTEVNNIDTSSSFVKVARNHEEFLQLVANTLASPTIDRNAVQAYIDANSWCSRFESSVNELIYSLLNSQGEIING